MSLKPFSLCLLFILLVTTVRATTYYVSPSGNDANTGTTREQAWATISPINSSVFYPGDSILFEGGASFGGNIFFSALSRGTAENPIVVSSFGNGRAIINSGASFGIKAYNTAGFRIERLKLEGAGRAENKASGIEFYMDLAGTRLPYISIDSVEVSGFHDVGISIGSWKGSSGFDDISITHSTIHDNGDAGISSYAEARLGHKNLYVGYNKVYDNSGLPEKTNLHSGNGIVIGGVDGALIEYCEAYNNGWLNAWKDGGPVGIWGWHCNNLVIQFNESHHNKTGTGKDGGGFDIDGGCTNCSMQYNYAHDNDGAGYLIAQYNYAPAMKGLVVRYNISENDARKNGYGAIHLWSSGANGGIQDAEIYNNTVYLTPAAHGTPRGIYVQSGGVKNVRIRNNIIQTTGGLAVVYVDRLTDLRFEGNNYWSSGSAFKIKWGANAFTSLEAWRAATGQEQKDEMSLGFTLDPELKAPGNGISFDEPGMLYRLESYQLKSSSALHDKGLNMADFGVDAGGVDFWGNNIEKRSSFGIGAHQLTATSRLCLYGGPVFLSFGNIAGGTYSGKGLDNEGYFNPELSGAGNHPILYSYTDAAGKTAWDTHTFTVLDTALTEWKGQETASNDWFDGRNWSTCVPTSAIDVQIPPLPQPNPGKSFLPVIKAGEHARVKNLKAAEKVTIGKKGTLEVHGAISGQSLNVQPGSILIFESEEAQPIPGGDYDVLLLQGSGAKMLAGNISVSQQLSTQAKLFLGDYSLNIRAQGEIVAPSAAAYVVTNGAGFLSFEAVGEGRQRMFPVGTAASYTPATVNNSGDPDAFRIRVVEGVWENGMPGSPSKQAMVNRTWYVEEGNPGGSNVSLSLQWNEKDEMADFNRAESFVSHYEGGKWSQPAKVATPAATASLVTEGAGFTKSMDHITSFSPFSVGSFTTILPVTLSLFEVKKQGEQALLQWETIGEKNNRGFYVEVSFDGREYRSLGFVASKSPDSKQLQQYSFLDTEKNKSGTRYYRLQQEDFDGTQSFSWVRNVWFEGGVPAVSVYPNPFSEEFKLDTFSPAEGMIELVISDGTGRKVMKKKLEMQIGNNRHDLSLGAAFAPGLYLVSVNTNGTVSQFKILKK